jgi:hypothetical protein
MTKIEVSFNNHLKNCVCEKCHRARILLGIIRGDKPIKIRFKGTIGVQKS